jgi:RsbT co-antagonist protein rsbRD N-terminal domain
MDANETNLILEMWVARMAEVYPRHAASLLSNEQDPFRNPVGDSIRRSLSQLLRELLGEMETGAIDSALDAIVRIEVVQGIDADQAVTFLSLLKPILRVFAPQEDSSVLAIKVDWLVAAATEKYALCRQQLTAIRANEVRRMSHAQLRIRRRQTA